MSTGAIHHRPWLVSFALIGISSGCHSEVNLSPCGTRGAKTSRCSVFLGLLPLSCFFPFFSSPTYFLQMFPSFSHSCIEALSSLWANSRCGSLGVGLSFPKAENPDAFVSCCSWGVFKLSKNLCLNLHNNRPIMKLTNVMCLLLMSSYPCISFRRDVTNEVEINVYHNRWCSGKLSLDGKVFGTFLTLYREIFLIEGQQPRATPRHNKSPAESRHWSRWLMTSAEIWWNSWICID